MKDNIEIGCMLIVVLVLLVVGVMYIPVYRGTLEEVTITVQEKERVDNGDSSKYLIWSEEGEVFENTDSLSFLKYNSSDIYGDLREGETYCIKVAGWRVRFLSMYRNVIGFCNYGN